MSSKFESKF